MAFFPSRLNNGSVKWYSDKGNYGKIHKHLFSYSRISYYAVTTSDDVVELLWLNRTFDVLMAIPCESEADAMDVFDDPTILTWHKMMDDSITQRMIDCLFLFLRIWNLLTGSVYTVWLAPILLIFLIGTLVAGVRMAFPLYGNHTLLNHAVWNLLAIFFTGFILYKLINIIVHDTQQDMKNIFIGTAVIVIFLIPFIYCGKSVLNVIADINDEPVSVELSDAYYYVSSGYRTMPSQYIIGKNNGRRYSFKVNGIPAYVHSRVDGAGSITIIYYAKSKAVKEIVIE